jgi:hypothetical protein
LHHGFHYGPDGDVFHAWPTTRDLSSIRERAARWREWMRTSPDQPWVSELNPRLLWLATNYARVFDAWATDDPVSFAEAATQWRAQLLFGEEIDRVMRTGIGQPWATLGNRRVVKISGNRGRSKKRLRTDKEARGGSDWVRHTELGDEGDIRQDHLRAGGWHIQKAGTTGTPVGAPRHGMTGAFLRTALERDLGAVAELCVVRGKKDKGSRDLRDRLAIWLCTHNVNRLAAAELLDYDRRTIDRLYRKGQQMIELLENPDRKLDTIIAQNERAYWATAGYEPSTVRCADGLTRPRHQCREVAAAADLHSDRRTHRTWRHVGDVDEFIEDVLAQAA